ncbi:MAG: spermidine synthase [Elusimicrobiales bacterium]
MKPSLAQRLTPGLFALTLFCSAALIFVLQPLFTRLTTPLLGGAPAVWNASMVFFQAALLLGYVYAHLLARLRDLRLQIGLHAAVLGLAALALPLRVSGAFGPPNYEQPALWLLAVLAVSVGAPFAAASATAPLLQAWYARTGRADAHDPYYLYAASNLGSFSGLLAYPALVEPLLGNRAQSAAWQGGYWAVAALVLAAAAAALLSAGPRGGQAEERAVSPAPAPSRRLYWLGAAAVPSALVLGVTLHISHTAGSTPLFWVVPLALYLATFVIAFSRGAERLAPAAAAAYPFALLLLLASYLLAGQLLPVALGNLAGFFLSALLCHQALARSRPAADRLTEFYFFVSLGGVLGGAAAALLAPLVFNNVYEYPLALAAAALFLPRGEHKLPRLASVAVIAALALGVAMALLRLVDPGWAMRVIGQHQRTLTLAAFWTCLAAVFLNRARPARLAALVLLTFLVLFLTEDRAGRYITQERGFFGILRTREIYDPASPRTPIFRIMTHSNVVHGAQLTSPGLTRIPMTYYNPRTALGEAVLAGLSVGEPGRVALVGLGAGASACLLRPADKLTIFEIDPAVVRLAASPGGDFTYVRECQPGARVVLGDARLKIAGEPDGAFDVIVVDAFSGDSIPAHLLTREALALYLRKISERGIVVLHLSNASLALISEAARLARDLDVPALFRVSPAYDHPYASYFGALGAGAMIIPKSPAVLPLLPLSVMPGWSFIEAPAGRAWSDDYINIPRALWRSLIGENYRLTPL